MLHFEHLGTAEYIDLSRRCSCLFSSVNSKGKSDTYEGLLDRTRDFLTMFVRPLDLLVLEWIKQSILDDSTPSRYLGPNLDRPPFTRHIVSDALRRNLAEDCLGNFQITSTRVLDSAVGVFCPHPLIRMYDTRDLIDVIQSSIAKRASRQFSAALASAT